MIKSGFSFSFERPIIDTLFKKALEFTLNRCGINQDFIHFVTTAISAFINCSKNPLTFISLQINGSAAFTGEKTAWKLIQSLPKLKLEDIEPSVKHEDDETKVIGNQIIHDPFNNVRKIK